MGVKLAAFAVTVGVMALLAVVGTFMEANRQVERWRAERAEFLDKNLDEEYPDDPRIVRKTMSFAVANALIVAVVTSIVALLPILEAGTALYRESLRGRGAPEPSRDAPWTARDRTMLGC